MRTRILTDVGLSIDFEDCRLPSRDPALVPVDFAVIERDVRQRLISCSADLGPVPAPAHAWNEGHVPPVEDERGRCMLNT